MLKFHLRAPALFAGAFIALNSFTAFAGVITEDFSSNPLARGWKIFGDTNAFTWDSDHQNLAVTWDSSKPNSYFYQPLGTILARDDDFSVSFDLLLHDIAAGVNTNKPDAIEVAIGFFNFADATSGIVRGSPAYPPAYPDPKNLVEFDYFPYFVDPIYGAFDPSVAPTILSTNYNFDGAFGDYLTLTNGVVYHVQMTYTAADSTLNTIVTLPGQTNVLVSAPATVSGTNDFRVDTFSVSSYTDNGDPYDSLLAHGTVDNITVTTPPPPAQNLVGTFAGNNWQVQFNNRTNWTYTLMRTADFQSWQPASATVPGNGASLTLTDTNPPPTKAFYRISAQRP